ncbi:hypothetical protein H7J87_15685 [Mycolicibacterium wolinskyi]|uniref:Uncharacterized protein n=1 Tax=Mycolicibacterium wolinskyi TaxID=59750 RepID=A0A1X2F7W8_9MYCO|nr:MULTISPECIES: hypothetical protein [Mycolicibacterium]MCV7286767.1 hypothetical protein [Mycolicibacterium wolinskyi]MCV7293748.1 hypothetical protein [Mycolicibacterium goodii]ORX14541.1 hypothetical protein AWC31_25475 [Mycolicibacterium wolinskyi]
MAMHTDESVSQAARPRREDAIGIPPERPTLIPAERYYSPAPGFTHLVLSGEERRIINVHRNLERYLQPPKDALPTGTGT